MNVLSPALAQDKLVPAEPARRVSLEAILDNPNVPSPPALALQIVEKASQPNCDPDELLALLGLDSGLCAQILKTVNSGMFGLKKPVGSLKQAILILGIRPLRSLVLGFALPAMRISNPDEFVMRYWQESVAGAVIARELAVLLRRKDPDDDLIAGLLRDLGMLVLREAFPAEYGAIWRKHPHWNERQCELEVEALGVDHTEVSAVVLESWKLPPELHEPIRFHHNPAEYTDAEKPLQQRAWLLYFASKVASLRANSVVSVSELLRSAQEQFGLDKATLVKFLSSVTPKIQEWAALLKVDIGQCPNYSAIMSDACQELVRLTVESVQSKANSTGNGKRGAEEGGASTDRTQHYARPAGGVDYDVRTIPDFEAHHINNLPAEGAWLNGYEVRELLGRGGMGVVFKAFDPSLCRFVAVKMMTPQGLVRSESREWFMREARAAAAIQHEHVVTIHVVSEMNGLPYIVMEYLDGTSLQERVDRNGPLPIADVIRIGAQVAHGLQAAHDKRVIHRDIKPGNILVASQTGSVKITDFGLACVVEEANRSQDGSWAGTPQYMAPEQFVSSNVDHRADLFSLGSTLYTLSTGKPPFKADSIPNLMQQIRTAAPTPPRLLRPDLPVWLANLITKLQSKSPAGRSQSAAEVARELAEHS